MKVRAIENFSGLISMSKGEERELDNELLLADLLKAGYIEEIAPVQQKNAQKGSAENESKRNKRRVSD